MIDAITWENSHLYGNALVSQHRLRHRVFVEREGYQVPTYHGLEYDQYDTPAAVYLVWRDEKGEARGISRLIPTERPYMIRDIWSDFVTARLCHRPLMFGRLLALALTPVVVPRSVLASPANWSWLVWSGA
jgi:N-acyl-L-homoserine lactone synthetase